MGDSNTTLDNRPRMQTEITAFHTLYPRLIVDFAVVTP